MKTRWPLPLVLPEISDAKDACVTRLERLVSEHPGISLTHAASGGTALCVHFDPSRIQLAEVERVVKAAGARLGAEYGHASIAFKALAGEDSGRRLEAVLRLEDGVIEASASIPAQLVRVEYDRTKVDPERLARIVNEAGFGVVSPATQKTRDKEPSTAAEWLRSNRELLWSLAAAAFLVAAWFGGRFADWPRQLTIPLYLVAYGFGAWDLARHTLASLRRGAFTFDIDLLMLLAAVGAAALDAWAEGAFLLTLFALAHALEHYAMDRARGAIRALADLVPRAAHVQRNGVTEDVPVEAVRVDDIVLVRPGEQIPVDGAVTFERSTVNQAPVTGESVPVDKDKGDEVFAGTVNGEGALEVQTTRAVGDRTLDRVVRLVEEAQTAKAPTQQFTERFERVFVPVVLVSAALIAVAPPLLGWSPWTASIYRALALLVAASPCALALGTPSAVLAGIAHAARRGVLIKGGVHLENLGSVRAVAFDKTGTLTIGQPEVTDVVPADDVAPDDLVRLAAAVERQSQHPLAQAVVREAARRRLVLPAAGPLESLTARGVRALVGADPVEIGSARLWEDQGERVPVLIGLDRDRLEAAGRSVMMVRHGDRWLGVLGLADTPRPEASAVLAQLRAQGIRSLTMLTGDNRGAARVVAAALGLDDVRADLLPEGKVAAIASLTEDYGGLAMVGDGVNDAPALAQATVGIAMGGAGTGVALETSDIALMGDDLTALPFAIGLSRQAARIIRQNLYVSLAVVAGLIVSTLAGWSGIGAAVVLHEGSTLLVIANSLRLLGYTGK